MSSETSPRLSRRRLLGGLSGLSGASLLSMETGAQESDDPSDEVRWTETYGPEGRLVECTALTPGEDGYYLAGSIGSPGGTRNGWITSVGEEGETRWELTNRRLSDEAPLHSLCRSHDGGCTAAGDVTTHITDGTDLAMLSVDSDGEPRWGNQYARGWNVSTQSVIRVDDGYVAAGYARSYSTAGTVVVLLSTEPDGTERWIRTIGESGAVDVCYDVLAEGDGFTLTGGTNAVEGDPRLWLFHVDDEGDVAWEATYDVDGSYSVAHSFVRTDDGGYLLGGRTGSSEHIFRAVVIKTDGEGTEEWRWVNDIESACYALVSRPDGGAVLAGRRITDGWLAALSEEGELVASETYAGAGNGAFQTVVELEDGYLAGGWTHPFDADATSAWLVSTDRLAGPDAEPIDPEYSVADQDEHEDDGLPGFSMPAAVAGIAGAYALSRGRGSDDGE